MRVSLLLFFCFVCICISEGLKTCGKGDFIYTYTECRNNTRWRVAVPGKGCEGGTVQVPKKANKCNFQCESGKHLSQKASSQKCDDCPGGTYSIRGGVRIDEWVTLPPGFTNEGERSVEVEANGINCSEYKWVLKGDFLASPTGAPCSATLRYTVNMVKAGEMKMEYKYTDSGTLFMVEVENDHCQVEAEQNWVRPTHQRDGWKKHTVKLDKGRNRVFIILINDTSTGADVTEDSPIAMIRSVEFHNVALAQTCTKCRAGTHSTPGATTCAVCKGNTFSKRGSSECKPCEKGKFSLPGSDECRPRPLCKNTDYFFYWAACDQASGKSAKTFAWIQPKVCKGGVSLPASGKETKDCSKEFCNLGSYRVNASACAPCPAGKIAKDEATVTALANATEQTACMACPPNSQPIHNIVYDRWWTLPPNMSTNSIGIGDHDSAATPNSGHWLPMGDHIRSGYGVNSWFSILQLSVAGLTGHEDEFSSHLSFDFQLKCKQTCKLYFMMRSDTTGHMVAHQWNQKRIGRETYSYWLRHRGFTDFMWVFERPTLPKDMFNSSNTDFAAIYRVNVTHVKGVAASACERCPLGVDKKCVPCPSGQFFDSVKGHCFPCPPGHVVSRIPARSKKDCRLCGPGLRPHNGNSCVVDLMLSTRVNGARKGHDLRPLKGNETTSGAFMFASRGTRYRHVFVFTLDNGQKTEDLPLCSSNITSFGDDDDLDANEPSRNREVRSLVCQYTLVPPRRKGGKYLSTRPDSLGDRLVSVMATNHSAETFKKFNQRLEESGWPRDDDNLDLHFTYVAEEKSFACPKSRSTIITLRCDPKSATDRGGVLLPPKCADGTCDGCNFHFMWKTRAACPICSRGDYEKVKGECRGGKQLIHYYPPKHCYFSVKEKHEKVVETVHCPLISSEAEIAIIVVLVVGFILITLLGYCWKRNRKLEYKYMKLVEGKGGQPGELPQAESCAVHEGEEEDDDVHIKSSGGTSSAFFSRFKQFRKTNTFGGDRMEAVNLTDNDEFGL